MTKPKNMKNSVLVLFFYSLFFAQCNIPKENRGLLISLYNSYQPEQGFLLYKDTIEVCDINGKIILRRYVENDNLSIDSLLYEQLIIKTKNIYGEIQSTQIKIQKPTDTVKIDLSQNNWQDYFGSLIITSLHDKDTLDIIGIESSRLIPQNYPKVQVWKDKDDYFVKLPKINKDSSYSKEVLVKKLGLQINNIKKLEVELRKINKLPISCSQTTDYYLIAKKDTLHINDGTCNWNGLSELYYILNGFSRK